MVLKEWVAFLFRIPRTFVVKFENNENKYLKIITVKGKQRTEEIFRVEHLLDSNLAVTSETLQREKDVFVKI